MKMVSIRLTYKFCSFLCLYHIYKNKAFVIQNCQLLTITVILNALPIYLTPRKDLLQCFEIMATSEMGKATISVDYNYYFSCLYLRLFFSVHKHAGNSYNKYLIYKRMLMVETIFHVSLVF